MPASPVFISYSHENQTTADRLRDDLQANGIAVWIDHESLIPGTPDWGRAIEAGIPQCQALVYVASPAAKNSPFVIHELDLAEDQKIPIYPFWAEGARWRDVAPFGRSRMQYIDARTDYQRAFKELLKTLRAQSARVTTPSPQGQAQPTSSVATGTSIPASRAAASAASGSASTKRRQAHPVVRALGAIAVVVAALALTVTLIVSGTPTALMRYLQAHTTTPTTTPHIALTETPTKQSSPTSSPTSIPLAPTITPATAVAHWTQVLSPNPNPNHDDVFDVSALASNNAWMVGYTWDGAESGPFRTLVEHWDGSSWSVVSSPSPDPIGSELYGVAALAPNNAWAVGNVIEHWNGSSWTTVAKLDSGSTFNDLSGITALAPDNIWAVGSTSTFSSNNPDAPEHTLIEHWNGATWTVVASPSPDASGDALTSVAAVSLDDIWAVGIRWKTSKPGGPLGSLIEHWNGASWSVVQSPDPGAYSNFLGGVTALAPNNVWAVGFSTNNANDPDRTLIEHWDGKSWTVAASVNAGSGNNALIDIAALAPDNIWAVGGASEKTLIEHWNGSSWATVASPNPNPTSNSLSAISALTPDTIWAVGANGNGTLAEHWVSSS